MSTARRVLTPEFAARCATIALGHVAREYPNKPDHTLASDDFLSPALIEAECLRRLLPAGEFGPWLQRFLPHLLQQQSTTLFRPATVSDRSDGKIAHLDGLNLSRAWCWRNLAPHLPGVPAIAVAEAHLDAALPHMAGDYMGEHWLATYAVLALEA